MANEMRHSPTPWRVEKNLYGTANIIETEGRQIAACARECPSADLDADAKQDEANAAFIVETVNAYEDLLAEKFHLADTNRVLAEETEKTWAVCDKLKGLLRRTVPCIESCIGHLRNDRATSLGDPKTMMAYTRTIEDIAVLLDEVRHALGGEEAGNGE